jgi:hypothetical protein
MRALIVGISSESSKTPTAATLSGALERLYRLDQSYIGSPAVPGNFPISSAVVLSACPIVAAKSFGINFPVMY